MVAFTPQVLVTMLFPLALALLLRARFTVLTIAVFAGVLVVLLSPRAIPDRQPSTSGTEVTIFSANLLEGAASPGPLISAIRRADPDIIALQEVTPANVAALRAAGVMAKRPFIVGKPAIGPLGYVTISRWPLQVIAGSGLSDGRWPEMHVLGTTMIFRNVHPRSQLHPESRVSWRTNLADIPGPRGRLRVVAGDFNATLDQRAFRALVARGYHDAGATTGNGFKWTWVVSRSGRLVIDHVLVAPTIEVQHFDVVDLPGSDHNAVVTRIRLPG